MRLRFMFIVLLLLTCNSSPVFCDIQEFSNQRPTAGAQTVYGPSDYWGVSAFNPTGIEVAGEYLLFVQTSTPVGPGPAPWEFCVGDQVVLLKAPATYDGMRGAFSPVKRITPCSCTSFPCTDPNGQVYGLGNVIKSQHDDKYYLFLENVTPGVDFAAGHFKDVFYAVSEDAYSWSFENQDKPLIAQSTICSPTCKVYSVIDPTLFSEQNHWWGFFLWGIGAPNHVGRMRVSPDSSRPNGFMVEILSSGTWQETNPDGTFSSVPDDVWPNAQPNSLIKTDSSYELWASLPADEDTNGCDDGQAGSGSTFVVRSVSEDGMGLPKEMTSKTRAMPTRNLSGRITPHIAFDPGGARILYSASTDRVCEDQNQAWVDAGNLFAGMEVLSSDISDAEIEDRFSPRSGRQNPSALDGSLTEIGGKIWSASSGLEVRDGLLTSGGQDNLIATLSFNPVEYGTNQQFSIEAEVDPTGSEWAAIGFAQVGGFFGAGQIWMLLKPNGAYTVFANGTTTVLAQGIAPKFVAGGFNQVELVYSADHSTVSATINGEVVLGVIETVFVPTITRAGLHLFDGIDVPGVTAFSSFRLKVSNSGLFSDGFEEGDPHRWSSIVE